MRGDELARFLRMHREGTSPETVSLPVNGRRRTPGLRREEVSQLAGVGLSWNTWLEQGRDITPSASVLDALARVYDLDPPERAHLFHLAGVALPASVDDYPAEAPAELRALVLGLEPNPAYLLGPRADVLVWNAAAARLFGEPSHAPDGVQNALWSRPTRSPLGASLSGVQRSGTPRGAKRTGSAPASARITCMTALIRARCVKACGKLPRCRPLCRSISSA